MSPIGRRKVRLESMRAAAVLIVSSLIGWTGAQGQERSSIRFRGLTVDDGLSQSSVNSIAQDPQGFMWFGTQDGLNRYDGYEFTVYKHDPENPGSLSRNFVWSLLVTRDGTLWAGTEGGGLERWNPSSQGFVHYRNDPNDARTLTSDRVRSLAEDLYGRLWVGTETGLNLFDPVGGRARRYRHDPADPSTLAHDQVRAVHVDRQGRLWVGTEGGGLDRLDPGARAFRHYRYDPADPGSLSNDRVRSILEAHDGQIWVGTYEGGLNRLDPDSNRFERFAHDEADPSSLAHDRVRALLQDRAGILWIGTDGGLSRLRPGERRAVTYRHDAADPHSLGSDRILSICQDRGGVLWVATQAGLSRWNPTVGAFAHLKQESGSPSTLSSNIVTALSGDPSTVWIGTYGGGLNALDRATGRFRVYRHDPADRRSLSDDRVMSLLCDRARILWVGMLEGGLARLDRPSNRFVRYLHDPADPTSLGANGVTSIHQDRDGILWIGLYRNGLDRLDPVAGSRAAFRHFRSDRADPSSLSDDRVMVISSDQEGIVWIGTEGGGLNRLDPRTGAFERFLHDPADPRSLGSDVVYAILEGRDETLWIGTQGGLVRWEPADRKARRGRFRRYTEKDGLPNSLIYGILEDGRGNLWISSNKGISQFDPRSGVFTNYDTAYGLQSSEFNFGASYASSDGEMFFGGNNGFNAFRPELVHGNPNVPPVILTGILAMNEPMALDRAPWEVDRIVLGYEDRVVSFQFSALDFTAPHRNRYAYMLEGLDPGWIDLGTMHRATYTKLPPGRYTFRVRGSNNDGRWNDAGISLPVEVLPPPWRTWWAYTLYGVALAGLVFAYARGQARKLRREAEYSHQLEREVEARTLELAQRNSELAEVNSRLEDVSLTDALTGLRNRRYLAVHLRKDFALVERHWSATRHEGQIPDPPFPNVLFLMMDLDDFKPVNDAYGHEAGDRILKAVRDVFDRECRQSDTVIRWGGDEFLIVCRDVARSAAEGLAERIRLAIGRAVVEVAPGRVAGVGCSLGFAFYPFVPSASDRVSWEKSLTLADRALYLAKEIGKGTWLGILGTETRFEGDLAQAILDEPARMVREGIVEVACNREEVIPAISTSRP